jgi:general secretion pathway protein B
VSFILDALRKSEHERQRSALPGLAQVPLATPPAQLPRWALILIGVLAAAVLVLGGAWWQSTRAPVEVTASPPVVERPLPLPPTATAPPPDRATTLRAPPPESAAPARENGLATAAAPIITESAAEASFDPAPGATTADEPALPSAAALLAAGIAVPELRLELHAFRAQPRDRFVFINGRKYVEGERLAEGPQLVAIVPTGAVLVHAGRRFLLVSE